jgi:hypothetical protein
MPPAKRQRADVTHAGGCAPGEKVTLLFGA